MAGIPVQSLPYPLAVELVPSDSDSPIEVIVPLDSGTVAEALVEIRGNVPGSRNTLELMSDALDAQTGDLTLLATRLARRYALIFG